MCKENVILATLLASSVAGLLYWLYKEVNRKPPDGATPEEVEAAFYEAMRHRDMLADIANSDILDREWF